jgi:hypothetical protein
MVAEQLWDKAKRDRNDRIICQLAIGTRNMGQI